MQDQLADPHPGRPVGPLSLEQCVGSGVVENALERPLQGITVPGVHHPLDRVVREFLDPWVLGFELGCSKRAHHQCQIARVPEHDGTEFLQPGIEPGPVDGIRQHPGIAIVIDHSGVDARFAQVLDQADDQIGKDQRVACTQQPESVAILLETFDPGAQIGVDLDQGQVE